ncbi:MAG TPA: RIO1 family regulatory kinase/ATPase [Dehalococcoidia bacterium]|nr:RIO1 family regulatory kinase/ATPase [Dehalococcoidia bacterium]
MGKNRDNEQLDAIQELIDRALIDEVLGVVKSGKEATVYCCADGDRLLAAKVYRSRNVRGFHNDADYRVGKMRGARARESRAVANRSRLGRTLAFASWVGDEYNALSMLHRAGADVPEPVAQSSTVILMEYLGDEDEPARMLSDVRPSPDEARTLFERLMRNIELMLTCDRVHGDLSPFNVLYYRGDVRIIDFPQAVDARFNQNALPLLERDIDRLCAYFRRFGVESDPWRLAHGLWSRFLRSEL